VLQTERGRSWLFSWGNNKSLKSLGLLTGLCFFLFGCYVVLLSFLFVLCLSCCATEEQTVSERNFRFYFHLSPQRENWRRLYSELI
jgi:hypothetical protein